MGNSAFGKIFKPCGKTPLRILIQGLDAAGKTTLLYQMKLGEVVITIPTIGFNVESLEFKNIVITAWDVGGRDKIRPLWRHYYHNTDAVVFVVDSNDRDRIADFRREMETISSEEELRDCVFAIVANKQDLPNAMPLTKMREALKLDEALGRNRTYKLFGASAKTGDGIFEIFDWILEARTSIKSLPSDAKRETRQTCDDKMRFLLKPLHKLKEIVWM